MLGSLDRDTDPMRAMLKQHRASRQPPVRLAMESAGMDLAGAMKAGLLRDRVPTAPYFWAPPATVSYDDFARRLDESPVKTSCTSSSQAMASSRKGGKGVRRLFLGKTRQFRTKRRLPSVRPFRHYSFSYLALSRLSLKRQPSGRRARKRETPSSETLGVRMLQVIQDMRTQCRRAFKTDL